MSEKFKDKYKIKSARLQNYDYSQNGMYFVTICTKDREELFGEIENGEMVLNNVGKITNQIWQEIPKHLPFVNLDTYQIMPNHIHGILEINKNNSVEARFIATKCVTTKKANIAQDITRQNANTTQDANIKNENTNQDAIVTEDTITTQDAINRVSTERKKIGGVTGENNPMLNSGSLANIIRWYKGRCSFEIRKQLNPITFAWQSRFYDHIIRKDESLQKIREYIKSNPRMWERDRNNVENVWM